MTEQVSIIMSQSYLEYIGHNSKRKVPRGYWKNKENHKKYIEWLGKKLGYTTMEHWYKISSKDITDNKGRGLLRYYNDSPSQFVIKMFPDYNWDKSKFINYKTEAIIHKFLLDNKSKLEIIYIEEQYPKEQTLDWCINPDTGRKLPYDFYIELVDDTKIIIECDGEQHYSEIPHFYRRNGYTLEKRQNIDIFKMNKALENYINIIRVHQEDVWEDRIDWKKELIDAINEIKNGNEITVKVLGCLKDKIFWNLE